MEDKQRICDLLCNTLQATRAGHDIKAIWYDAVKETAAIVYNNGFERIVNVAADSGAAMIRDIMNFV